jgi:DNA-directed RNA polymerase II subunit RPB1
VTSSTAIYYDPDPQHTVIPEDQELLDIYFGLEDIDPATLSPWLLRIELNWDRIQEKGISMEHIQSMVDQYFGSDLNCIISDDNADSLIMRIRIVNSGGKVCPSTPLSP